MEPLPTETSPPVIPDHTLLRPIGRGAYGEVWLARNLMGGWRAVKVIQRAQFESARPFAREFAGIQRYEPVSRSSEGLVHVLHVGRNDAGGYFYYVMELADPECGPEREDPVSGDRPRAPVRYAIEASPERAVAPEDYVPRTLRTELKRWGRLPTAECLRVGLDVVSGLALLHRQQLVHRDVKPANIVFVHGRAKLADLGLVSIHGEGRTFVGTEGYIPPEGPGTASADLYALGMVLYQASTGYPPDRFPDVPSEWLADGEGEEALELHEVILKACEGQRERRYGSADAMQADLALLQGGQSIRRVRALERRNARLRLVGLTVTVLLVCAVVVALFASYRARLARESEDREAALRERALRALVRAEGAERDARTQLYTALREQARATVRSGELGHRLRTLDALRRAGAISNATELRREVVAALALPDLRPRRKLSFRPDELTRVLDPAFERIAVGRGGGMIEIRAVSDSRVLTVLGAGSRQLAYLAVWSRDGRYLAVKRDRDQGGGAADLEVWDVTSARRVLTASDCLTGNALSFHPTLPRIMTARADGGAWVWDLESGRATVQFQLPGDPYSLRYAPDGDRFAVSLSGPGNVISVCDAATRQPEMTMRSPHPAYVVEWHPGGRWLAIPNEAGQVRLVDSVAGTVRDLGQHGAQAVEAAFSPDGDFLISGGWDNELICWDLRTGQRSFNLGVNSARVQIRRDGAECAVYISDDVHLFDVERPAAHREWIADLGRGVETATFSPDGRWLAAKGDQGIGVWDLTRPGTAGTVLRGQRVKVPFFDPQSMELFAYWEGALNRWRIRPGDAGDGPQLEPIPIEAPAGLRSATVVSNELVLVALDGVRRRDLADLDAGVERVIPLRGGTGRISPDGRALVIHEPRSRELQIHRLPGFEAGDRIEVRAGIWTMAFTPDGAELAVVTRTGLEFFDTARWQRTRELAATFERQSRIIFAPDGASFWLTRDGRSAELRDGRTLDVLLPLPRAMSPLALSTDGRQLAVAVDASRMQVWDLTELRRHFQELGLNWTESRPLRD